MPYIEEERRPFFEEAIQSVVNQLGGKDVNYNHDAAKGELNYVIYSVIKGFLRLFDLRIC